MTIYFKGPAVMEGSAKVHPAIGGALKGRLPQGVYRTYGKRVLDVLFVLFSTPIMLPLIVLCALLAARDGAWPFYWQKRIGRNGRIFYMVKIRTMVENADDLLQAHLEENADAHQEWSHKQKLCQDPRITQFGRFLRKSSLDELPQLWNVLRGEMSLVGPRPMMVDQQSLYPGKDYYKLCPGITGFWQVSDRNQTSFAARAAYDSEYYTRLSLTTDLTTLARTITVVLQGTGH